LDASHSSLLNLLSSFLGGELESLVSLAPLLVEEKGLMVSRWEAKGSLVVGSLMAGGLVAEVPCGWDSVVAILLFVVGSCWFGEENGSLVQTLS